MNRRIFNLIMIAIFSLSLLNAELESDLWSRARAIVEANYQKVPGITHHRMQTVDDKSGKILQSSDLVFSHSLNEEGKITTRVLNSEADGDDLEDQGNDRMIKEMLENDLAPKREGIFFTEPGNDLQVNPTGELMDFDGSSCWEYQIEYRTKNSDNKVVTFSGSVWLADSTGAPLYMIFKMDRTPRLVKELTIERWYHYDEENRQWHQKELRSTADVRFLLKKMTNTTIITYSDYWTYPIEETKNEY